jgi:predicted ATPase
MQTVIAQLLIYAVVGGPGSGKTSIIESLKMQSEVVVFEAATHLIEERQKQNIAHPWENPDFNFHVSLFQEYLEEEAFQEAKQINKSRVFVDRGILDPLVYEEIDLSTYPIKVERLENYHRLKNRIAAMIKDRYEKIFFILPYTSLKYKTEQTKIRKETTTEALKNGEHVLELYKRFIPEDKIIFVPGDLLPNQRAAFILSHL